MPAPSVLGALGVDPKIGRPSIDPELMIRMLVLGYVVAIRSERALCRDVQVNFAGRWFCGLSIKDKVPDHSVFSRAPTSGSARATCSAEFSSASLGLALQPGWSVARDSPRMQA